MPNSSEKSVAGQCMCGSVSFIVQIENYVAADACHCQQCRQWSGHFWASINVPQNALSIESKEQLRWFRASPRARRGFCQQCGSSLFWHADGIDEKSNEIAVALGSLEKGSGAKLEKHIFVAEKGDSYDLNDDLPLFDTN